MSKSHEMIYHSPNFEHMNSIWWQHFVLHRFSMVKLYANNDKFSVKIWLYKVKIIEFKWNFNVNFVIFDTTNSLTVISSFFSVFGLF
ncbi:hypothetical protein KUTeg_004739 [Tegillarca granosa]|uniref:Uncharacterized protein n=1 Tax=Tegillarca granosa TaxID=220873 RepID=A0ABQ9FHP5_TEGGR|nr:hypothetical protein KUTeg_004739 [Tegillarca granosa]